MKEKHSLRNLTVIGIMLVLFAALAVLNISLGSVKIPFSETTKIFFGKGTNDTFQELIWRIRLPRMTAAIILGGALALSGFLLQTFFNNPIAGPFVLGISSGAKLAVALLMVYVIGRNGVVTSPAMILSAFAGALLSMGFVLLVSQRIQKSSMLIVAGVMIGYICSAITDFVVTFASDASIVNLHNWSKGSFSGASWEDVGIMAVVVLVTSVIVFFLSKPVGAYQMGESYAKSIGLNIKLFRASLVVLSSFLAACVTAFAGPVSFVGIAVPHLVKSALKTSKPLIVIPTCFLGGAIFCLGCDLIARTVFAPTEISISSVTAIFGAPIVIYIMVKRRSAVR